MATGDLHTIPNLPPVPPGVADDPRKLELYLRRLVTALVADRRLVRDRIEDTSTAGGTGAMSPSTYDPDGDGQVEAADNADAVGGVGIADLMRKSVYDPDLNNKVEHAEVADAAPWSGITGTPSTYAPSAHASSHESGGSDVVDADTLDTLHAADLCDKATYDTNDDGIVNYADTAQYLDDGGGGGARFDDLCDKATYDTNDDGVVDEADLANEVAWDDVSGKADGAADVNAVHEDLLSFAKFTESGTDTFYKICELQASSGTTPSGCIINIFGGRKSAADHGRMTVMLSSKDGLDWSYHIFGGDSVDVYNRPAIKVYLDAGTSRYKVYLWWNCNNVWIGRADAYGYDVETPGAVSNYTGWLDMSEDAGSTSTPSGSLAFDSTDQTTYPAQLIAEDLGVKILGGLNIKGYTTSAAAPTTTQYPSDKDCGVHYDSGGGAWYFVFNAAGSIKKVALT